MDPKEPFRAVFKITNEWRFTINSVRFVYGIDRLRSEFAKVDHSTNNPGHPAGSLAPKESTSIQIEIPFPTGHVYEAYASIRVFYKPTPFWEHDKRACFMAVNNKDGTTTWVHAPCRSPVFSN